ncbi:hypothetical protein A1D24_04825 [Testudinibacter aquarius]|nr:hypothetical protein A1D24_04825 [Testudinibacter aquarius]
MKLSNQKHANYAKINIFSVKAVIIKDTIVSFIAPKEYNWILLCLIWSFMNKLSLLSAYDVQQSVTTYLRQKRKEKNIHGKPLPNVALFRKQPSKNLKPPGKSPCVSY